MTRLAKNKNKARELMEKISSAEYNAFDAYMLMRMIIIVLTIDGDNQLVEILLKNTEKEIENFKIKHKVKEIEREKFDKYLKRGEEC